MSHELKTPLNAIIGYSEMLLKGMGGTLTEKQEKYTHSIAFSGYHLLGVVTDILDISKAEAGKIQLIPESLEVRSIVEEVFGIVKEMAAESRCPYRLIFLRTWFG